MMKASRIRSGDVLYSDDNPKRSFQIVHIEPYPGEGYFADWHWSVWWLGVTSESGASQLMQCEPIGPWHCGDNVPFHKKLKRSERNVHDENGDPEGAGAAS